MPDIAQLAAWLASYRSELLDRALTPAERTLAEEVLVDFMLDEPDLPRSASHNRFTAALGSLVAITSEPAAAARLRPTIEDHVRELEGRLARQEHVNAVMREHLIMLSGAVRDSVSKLPIART